MRLYRWSAVFGLLFLSTFAGAQDQTNFTQFYVNPYLYNPSYAGIDGQPALSIIYRKQWMTIDGGPTIANFSLQGPITPRASWGLSVTNDSKGLLNNSSLLLTFGYNIPLAEHSFIRFGISAGGAWNMVDMAKLESISTDPALEHVLDNNASLAGNAGISFHIKSFQLGASMPTIFAPSYFSADAFSVTEIKPFESLIINASNRVYFGDDKFVFEPYALYRMNADLPPQFEVAGVLHLNHVVWLGGSYKEDFGISALAGIKVKNALAIGGSYSLQNSGTNELNSPSFEVSLTYLLGKRKKDAPLYSFVNTVKEKEKKPDRKSASELIAEKRKAEEAARKQKQEELAKQKREEEEAKKKADELARKAREEEAERARQEEIARQAEIERQQELAARTQPPVDTTTHTAVAKPPAIDGRHETFKRGTSAKELPAGEYVIAGVFSSEANANRYTNGLRQLGYLPNYGFLTQKNLWYVYMQRYSDINRAREERDKFRKLRMFKDAWLLTVEN